MSETLQERPAPFDKLAYLPRVTRHDGRAIEDALAGPTLFDPGVRLEAAVVDAAYAAEDPPLLKRLREEGVPRLIEPQTLRFTGERYLSIAQFEQLPYAPRRPLTTESFTPSNADQLARDVMLFEQDAGATCYLAAGLPYYDRDLQSWLRHNDRLLAASCSANGGAQIDRKPLIAQVAPGRTVIANPELVVNRLLDYPIDAVYVQALRLDPVGDSVEKLAQYVRFLLAIKEQGLPVIAARVGAFGLVLQALGILAFDSGLAQAEQSDLAALNRAPTEKERERRGKGGGPGRRIYLEQLKTTLHGRHAGLILDDRALRSRFVCTLGCCQHRGFEDLPERRRQHYLWVRHREVEELRDLPTEGMRHDRIHEQLRDARETGMVVRRALANDTSDLPSFAHLDRWIAVLGRDTRLPAIA